MTRLEVSGIRSLEFSQWIRQNLPDSHTGYRVGNQDWIFYDSKRRILLLAEEKTHGSTISEWMSTFIKTIMHPALAEYCPLHGIDYRGYWILRFANTSPCDGRIWLHDGSGQSPAKELTERELVELLSFA